MYANFSYKSAPKPVGRIDGSRFERVKWSAARLRLDLEEEGVSGEIYFNIIYSFVYIFLQVTF